MKKLACFFLIFSFFVSLLIYLSLPIPLIKTPLLSKTDSGTVRSLPQLNDSLSINIRHKDARLEILRDYLQKNDSLLFPFASDIIEVSDNNNLDFRTLVAIAQCESNLGKRIPPNSFNAWGYGVYGDLVTKFSSWQDGIIKVAEGISKNYIEHGLETPEQVMGKYTPPSLENGGSWAKCVRSFFQEIESF